jgi:cardiolipin synthase A/B
MTKVRVVAVALAGLLVAGTVGATPHARASSTGLRVLIEPQAGMSAIDRLLGSATRTVDLVMYELEDPHIEAILAADAHRGDLVRVILNEHYTEADNAAAYSFLRSHGVLVRWASARFDLTHEKCAVIDGSAALVMTLNFTPQYYATTRDVAVVDTQPADVEAISRTFDADWSGSVARPAAGADLLWSPDAEVSLINLISSAKHSVLIENEEMDEPYIENALQQTARRGVKVTVVMTADSEWDAAFSQLRHSGVTIRTYPNTYDGLYIHAKVIVVDPGYRDARVFVGSENFSVASLLYNRELGIITPNAVVVRDLAQMVTDDAARA